MRDIETEKKPIPVSVGSYYHYNGLYIMLVGHDYDICFIGIMAHVDGFAVQCPFAPVSSNVVYDFISNGEYIGRGNPSSIEDAINAWKDNNAGHKSFFEISIHEIFKITLTHCDVDLSKLDKDTMLPNVFPARKSTITTGNYVQHSVTGGKLASIKINGEFN
jgi:hypothetical protein